MFSWNEPAPIQAEYLFTKLLLNSRGAVDRLFQIQPPKLYKKYKMTTILRPNSEDENFFKHPNDSAISLSGDLRFSANKTIILHQSEKNVFKSNGQLVGYWNQVPDDEEAWMPDTQSAQPSSSQRHPSWTPMYVWSSSSQSWRGNNNNNPRDNFGRFKYTRKNYM
jgi:hypothetical protein